MNKPDTRRSAADLCVREARGNECEFALRLLCDGAVPELTDADRLLVATRDEAIVAAGWLQFLTEEVGAIWVPTSVKEDAEAERLLAATLRRDCDDSSFGLVRALLTDGATDRAVEWARQMGLVKTSQLASLYCPLNRDDVLSGAKHGPLNVHSELRFEPFDPLDPKDSAFELFAQLTQETYQQSLDCPTLTAEISGGKVLGGYLRHSQPESRHWFRVVRASSTDGVGVLVLHHDDEDEQMELLYLGVAPRFRGLGFGATIVEFAKSYGHDRGCRRMTLAVDVRNGPAIAIYHEAGMSQYAQYDLYARILQSREG